MCTFCLLLPLCNNHFLLATLGVKVGHNFYDKVLIDLVDEEPLPFNIVQSILFDVGQIVLANDPGEQLLMCFRLFLPLVSIVL